MKMTRKNLFGSLLMGMMCLTALTAQETTETDLSNGTIDQQFEFLMDKSNNYKNYKVIRTDALNRLRRNTLDSVARIEKERDEARALGSSQKTEIESLKKELAGTNEQLANITEEKDSISFFGALISKPAYKGIMWGIVALLTLVLGWFIYKFNNANAVTQQARQSLSELELEYEEHRRKALEREQKARRELQDVLNQQKISKSNK